MKRLAALLALAILPLSGATVCDAHGGHSHSGSHSSSGYSYHSSSHHGSSGTSSHASSTGHRSTYSSVARRDKNGKIARSSTAKHEFEKETGYPHGRKGYVVDHIVPLKRGGADAPSNMQWQTIQDAKSKDKRE